MDRHLENSSFTRILSLFFSSLTSLPNTVEVRVAVPPVWLFRLCFPRSRSRVAWYSPLSFSQSLLYFFFLFVLSISSRRKKEKMLFFFLWVFLSPVCVGLLHTGIVSTPDDGHGSSIPLGIRSRKTTASCVEKRVPRNSPNFDGDDDDWGTHSDCLGNVCSLVFSSRALQKKKQKRKMFLRGICFV